MVELTHDDELRIEAYKKAFNEGGSKVSIEIADMVHQIMTKTGWDKKEVAKKIDMSEFIIREYIDAKPVFDVLPHEDFHYSDIRPVALMRRRIDKAKWKETWDLVKDKKPFDQNEAIKNIAKGLPADYKKEYKPTYNILLKLGEELYTTVREHCGIHVDAENKIHIDKGFTDPKDYILELIKADLKKKGKL